MNAFEYAKYAIELCSQYNFVKSIELLLLDEPVVKIKAIVDNTTFIHIFYNAETQKYSFALIRNNKRIFGADNTKQWHIHPLADPTSHQKSAPLDLKDFLEILFRKRDKWLS
ncbi:MAG: hypothetical protein LWW94_09475 [Candidatus Desulfofervidaceae bacterium]|nr:hypothetical protein [Candidatus Desulfofervidaceae bacterium]